MKKLLYARQDWKPDGHLESNCSILARKLGETAAVMKQCGFEG